MSGKVTFNGEPVEQGYLNFIPEGGGPSAGAAILKGEYRIGAEKGVVPGPNRVEIHATYKTGRMVPGINDPNELVDEWGELIPAKYHKDSPLKEEVAEGESTIDFKLEGDSPAPKGSPKQ